MKPAVIDAAELLRVYGIVLRKRKLLGLEQDVELRTFRLTVSRPW